MPINEEKQFNQQLKNFDNQMRLAEKELIEYITGGMKEGYATLEQYKAWAQKFPYYYASSEEFVNDTIADIPAGTPPAATPPPAPTGEGLF
jgi:hypothetical protein